MKLTIGITGASGTIYAERLLYHLLSMREQGGDVETIAVILTQSGREVANFERPEFIPWLEKQTSEGNIVEYANNDFFTPVASGSAGFDALVVVPCSMGMLGRIAGGISDDLISRAADVMLKENSTFHPRSLILCPRETPLSLIHLRNMTTVCEAGGIVLPAMPSFYTHPDTLTDAVDTVVMRILSQLGITPPSYKGWYES